MGSPAFVVEAAHARGIKVAGLIGKTRQATARGGSRRDVIIAQGLDAGGHHRRRSARSRGCRRLVAIAGNTPVLAAGGIGTGKHLAAALCLGAAGVWTGTLWLASRESDSSMVIKGEDPGRDGGGHHPLARPHRKPAACPQDAGTARWEAPGAPPPLPMPLRDLIADIMQSAQESQLSLSSAVRPGRWWVRSMRSACSEIVFDMVDEAASVEASAGRRNAEQLSIAPAGRSRSHAGDIE